MSAIEMKKINKQYGEKTVLSDLSLSFTHGKITCIMGASGRGKTTLLRILAGLEKADSGEICNLPSPVSFLFQENRLCEDFSPISNIRFVVGKKMANAEIRTHLEALGITEYLDKPVHLMSGGMKRRVALARALCAPYDLLLLDEPFKGLDEALKGIVMTYLKTATQGKTVLCVTHDLDEAKALNADIVSW